MTNINIHELSSTIADALERALAGEEVFITDDKQTRLAQIVSVRKETNQLSDKPVRKGG